MSMQVDRVNQQRIFWSGNYLNPNSIEYQTLEDESSYAIDSAMALTSLNTAYVSNTINRFFPMNGKVTVNATLQMLANPYTKSTVVKRDIQRKLIEVIQVGMDIINSLKQWWGRRKVFAVEERLPGRRAKFSHINQAVSLPRRLEATTSATATCTSTAR